MMVALSRRWIYLLAAVGLAARVFWTNFAFQQQQPRLQPKNQVEELLVSIGLSSNTTTPFAVHRVDEALSVEHENGAPEIRTKLQHDNLDPPPRPSCEHLHSSAWLDSPRHNNYDADPLMDRGMAQRMILDLPHALSEPGRARFFLEQTLAYDTSRFVDDTEWGVDDAALERRWSTRLIYLSMLYHQHRHAIPEAFERHGTASNNHAACSFQNHTVNHFDYECPNAKFIVYELSGNGLGLNMRGGVASVLLAGLMSDRVVVLTNHESFTRYSSWALASCERRDYQCVFFPPTPCVLKIEEMREARHLTKDERRDVLFDGVLPANRTDDRVWLWKDGYPQKQFAHIARERLFNYSQTLIQHVADPDDKRLPVLRKAADAILVDDEPREAYNFALAPSRVHHALIFFAMRPRPSMLRQIDATLNEMVPSGTVDANQTFGLPIRASDKCLYESECLTFAQYMKGVSMVWDKHQQTTGIDTISPKVLFTTESTDMKAQYEAYLTNGTQPHHLATRYNFTFLTNDKDVTPDTGFVRDFRKRKDEILFTLDDAMVSALTSLKFQMRARVSLGNCCSNFHTMLSDFLMEGLGAASENHFQCLQEFDDPELAICCGWHKKCKDDRAKALAKLQKAEEAVAAPAQPKTTPAAESGSQAVADGSAVSLRQSSGPCEPFNSLSWLDSPRHNNYDADPLIDKAMARRMILDLPYALSEPGRARFFLEQTLAYDTSRFVDDAEWGVDDAALERRWSTRLIYLSMLYHQHRHAIPEALHRHGADTPGCDFHNHTVNDFDYECPEAKFIVYELSGNGLGLNMRGGVASVLLAGLMSDRVVILTNHESFTRYSSWALASCERRDYQCVFFPSTPCVLKIEEMREARHLTKEERRTVLFDGVLPANRTSDRVWLWKDGYPQKEFAPLARERLHNYAQTLIQRVPPDDKRLSVLRKAADAILVDDEPRSGYNFALAPSRVHHALVFFAMRPRPSLLRQIDTNLNELASSVDANTTFGLPIRASDKCLYESECLTFEQYMKGVSIVWEKHEHGLGVLGVSPKVLFTTESTDMKAQYEAYRINGSSSFQPPSPYNFTFLTNDKDVTPDTGFVRDFRKRKDEIHFTLDDAMISALTSLKFQMRARVSLGNCCSNFHTMLSDFLMEGLGAASENHFQCLQEFDDPELAICCGWHKKCKADRARALRKLGKAEPVVIVMDKK